MRDSISSLEKAISILKSYNPFELELGLTDISKKLAIPTSTTHRLINILVNGGLLDRNPNTGKFNIGHTFYYLGNLYLNSNNVIKSAEPVVKTLNELTGEAVNVGILEQGNIIFLMKEETRGAIRVATHSGTLFPAHCSSMGKALLSELPETEIDRLYSDENLPQRTKNSISTKTCLKQELHRIKDTGISMSRQEGFEGVEGVASVIRDTNGKAVAAISIAVPAYRMKIKLRKQLVKLVKMGCDLISHRLGYQDEDTTIFTIEELRDWWQQNCIHSLPKDNSITLEISDT